MVEVALERGSMNIRKKRISGVPDRGTGRCRVIRGMMKFTHQVKIEKKKRGSILAPYRGKKESNLGG